MSESEDLDSPAVMSLERVAASREPVPVGVYRCSNCNSPSPESSPPKSWKKLHDLCNFPVFRRGTRKLNNERRTVLEILWSLFNSFDEDGSAKELELAGSKNERWIMCGTCLDLLRELCQLHHKFISLSVLSNALLSEVMLARLRIMDSGQNKVPLKSEAPRSEGRKSRIKRKSTVKPKEKPMDDLKFYKSNDSVIEVISEANGNADDYRDDEPEPITDDSNFSQVTQGANSTETESEGAGSTNPAQKKCDQCGRLFNSEGALKVHIASHLRENKSVCKECGKGFKSQKALEWHLQVDHKGLKPFQCSQEGCEKKFRLKKKLLLHIRVVHEDKKPYPCPKCEKSFRTKYDLKVHDVGKHVQGDNSIGCSQCRRKFPTREELEKHVVKHEEEKTFKCSVCSKGGTEQRFQTLSRLKLHSKSHEDVPSFICSVCGKAYKHKRDLLLHEFVHRDESTFRFGCGDCSRRFYRIDLLRNHQSNERHFSPDVVGPSISKLNKEKRSKKRKSNNKKTSSSKTKTEEKDNSSPKNSDTKCDQDREVPPVSTDHQPTMLSSINDIDSNMSLEYRELTQLHPLTLISGNGVHPLSSMRGEMFGAQGNSSDSTFSLQPIPVLNLPMSNENDASLIITKDVLDRSIPAIDISAGAEQIGIDVIHAFINNLN